MSIEAVRRIRAQRPTACILMLTGSSISADIDRSRQAGAAEHGQRAAEGIQTEYGIGARSQGDV